jgi:hypothetical protein
MIQSPLIGDESIGFDPTSTVRNAELFIQLLDDTYRSAQHFFDYTVADTGRKVLDEVRLPRNQFKCFARRGTKLQALTGSEPAKSQQGASPNSR